MQGAHERSHFCIFFITNSVTQLPIQEFKVTLLSFEVDFVILSVDLFRFGAEWYCVQVLATAPV